ncbi:MAG: response regulator [Oligoflexia bacterium]|nr:response regulator [Oligoflexia bacterium]
MFASVAEHYGSCKGIIIVEDDDDIRNTLQEILELEGYPVVTAANGKEGLALLAKVDRPCLILLDFMMPVMNGSEFAEALSRDGAHSSIPIVVVSAYSDRARSIQSAGFLQKPIDFDDLLKLVRCFCAPIHA